MTDFWIKFGLMTIGHAFWFWYLVYQPTQYEDKDDD